MIRYAVALIVAVVVGSSFSKAQPAPCDPNAPLADEQKNRHRLAITAARQINTAQAQASSQLKRYAPLGELTNVSIPEGFEAQVSTDSTSYTFSVKDLQDACKFAVFSDQVGVIYTANPIR
jgi:hypothetical protein